MRSLVKIGLVIPMVALLAFGVALADTDKDQTELNTELNEDLNADARAESGERTARTGDGADEAPSARAKGDLYGERRSLAGRRANTGRAEFGNSADNRRWWSNEATLRDDASDSDSSGKSRSSSDEDDEETASPDGMSGSSGS